MVGMHDIVADPEIPQIGYKGRGLLLAPATARSNVRKELPFAEDDETGDREPKPTLKITFDELDAMATDLDLVAFQPLLQSLEVERLGHGPNHASKPVSGSNIDQGGLLRFQGLFAFEVAQSVEGVLDLVAAIEHGHHDVVVDLLLQPRCSIVVQ